MVAFPRLTVVKSLVCPLTVVLLQIFFNLTSLFSYPVFFCLFHAPLNVHFLVFFILRREVEAAVQSLKKGKSAGVDNIPAELVQAVGEDVITALTTICNRIWQTGEWPTPWTQSLVITLPNHEPSQQSSKEEYKPWK